MERIRWEGQIFFEVVAPQEEEVKTQFPVQLVPGLFPGGKEAKAWRQLPTLN